MSDPNFIILYVDDAGTSSAFYADLLGKAPVEASPTFAMFHLDSGVMLGLWKRKGVEPPAIESPGSAELAFAVADKSAVNTSHADWRKRGIRVIQAPVEMDFGYTFTALDPDGHRLRVFAPSAP
jgi:predicted enzyme related to lactoylglutathione lyase